MAGLEGCLSRSSTASVPEKAHRLDLLIKEQRTAVRNAHDGLKHSLAIFDKAHSKEEKVSAQMQVQSLLTRAEEMIFFLRVVNAIRMELEHVEEDIKSAKRNNTKPYQLYVRQEWLETRLEALLLTKKRHRPGARGKRNQAVLSISVPQKQSPSTRQSICSSSHANSTQDSLDGLLNDTNTSFSSQDHTQHSPVSTPREMGLPRIVNSSDGRDKSLSTATDDSNESWHSENEANWTLASGSIRRHRELGQSQTLSDIPDTNERGEAIGGNMGDQWSSMASHDPSRVSLKHPPKELIIWPSHEGEEESVKLSCVPSSYLVAPSPDDKDGGLSGCDFLDTKEHTNNNDIGNNGGFEFPRCCDVFGTCSWNVLPLATCSNLVQTEPETDHGTLVGEKVRSMSVVKGALDNFCSEAEVLKKLICDAAHTTISSGILVTTSRKSAIKGHNKTTFLPALPSSKPVKASSPTAAWSLTPLETHHVPIVQCSRRHYGTQKPVTYPRDWEQSRQCRYSSPHRFLKGTTSSCVVKQIPEVSLHTSINWKSRKPAQPIATKDGLFGREMFEQRFIKQNVQQLASSNVEVRSDSVQALGQLSCADSQVKDRLLTLLSTDKNTMVRYRALISLLQLGVITDQIAAYIQAFLSEGSPVLQEEVLQLLCREKQIESISEKLKGQTSLKTTLDKLVSDDSMVSLLAAIILSHGHFSRDTCVHRLKEILSSPSQDMQSEALECLTVCWHYSEDDVIDAAIAQMAQLSAWKLRKRAVNSLYAVREELASCKGSQWIFMVMMRRLPNEPVLAVRIAVGRVLRSLQLHSAAQLAFLNDLDSNDEVIRNSAVLALTAFELRGRKPVQLLLDCMAFDPSLYVRVQVVRAFGEMTYHNPEVVNCLINKSKGEDVLARESKTALQNIYKRLNY